MHGELTGGRKPTGGGGIGMMGMIRILPPALLHSQMAMSSVSRSNLRRRRCGWFEGK